MLEVQQVGAKMRVERTRKLALFDNVVLLMFKMTKSYLTLTQMQNTYLSFIKSFESSQNLLKITHVYFHSHIVAITIIFAYI